MSETFPRDPDATPQEQALLDRFTPRSIDRAAFGLDDDPKSPFADLEDENARLRRAIEDFILWWDMPPFVLDDDERLRAEVDALRAALR